MRKTIIASIVLAAFSAPVAAQDNVQPRTDAVTAQQSPKAKPAKEPKICRSTGSTGSRLGGRVCKTQAEWDQLAATGADRGLDSVQTMGGMR